MLTLTITMLLLAAMLVLGLLSDVMWSQDTVEPVEVPRPRRQNPSVDSTVEITVEGSAPVESLAA